VRKTLRRVRGKRRGGGVVAFLRLSSGKGIQDVWVFKCNEGEDDLYLIRNLSKKQKGMEGKRRSIIHSISRRRFV